MLRLRPPVTLRLEAGRLLAWPRQSGVRLRVIAGAAWVTQAHDMEDHFLQPGQTLLLRPGSRAIIGAETDDVSLRFEADVRVSLKGWWQRLRTSRPTLGAALPPGACSV